MVIQKFNPRARGRSQHVPGKMNALEAAYAEVLESERRDGTIQNYWFEKIKLVLADRCTYMPDFMVLTDDGFIEMHECKGFPTDTWKVKWKLSIDQFPLFKFVLVTRKNAKSEWVREEVAA